MSGSASAAPFTAGAAFALAAVVGVLLQRANTAADQPVQQEAPSIADLLTDRCGVALGTQSWLRLARLAKILSWVTLAWLGVEGAVGAAAGILAGSIVLGAAGSR